MTQPGKPLGKSRAKPVRKRRTHRNITPFEYPKLRACATVGELVAELARLPPDLEIRQSFSEGVLPVVFNRTTDVHLRLEENDGTWG
jgi:hypothetical protein